jgi:hypothetical protein
MRRRRVQDTRKAYKILIRTHVHTRVFLKREGIWRDQKYEMMIFGLRWLRMVIKDGS